MAISTKICRETTFLPEYLKFKTLGRVPLFSCFYGFSVPTKDGIFHPSSFPYLVNSQGL